VTLFQQAFSLGDLIALASGQQHLHRHSLPLAHQVQFTAVAAPASSQRLGTTFFFRPQPRLYGL
jgi:hypothetical protein